jgi:hypothetical protein
MSQHNWNAVDRRNMGGYNRATHSHEMQSALSNYKIYSPNLGTLLDRVAGRPEVVITSKGKSRVPFHAQPRQPPWGSIKVEEGRLDGFLFSHAHTFQEAHLGSSLCERETINPSQPDCCWRECSIFFQCLVKANKSHRMRIPAFHLERTGRTRP